MLVVKAQVERHDPDAPYGEELELETIEVQYADVEDASATFMAEDEVRDQLEEAGELVVCVWAEHI